MARTVVLVLHRAQSSPGRIAARLQALGYSLDIRHPSQGDPLPADLSGVAGVVIFGGPMSVNDDFAYVHAEIDWIGHVLKAGVPYLGICLGAQMLARQLGARVARHGEGRVEIGFHAIVPTEAGRALLPTPLRVYQWHSEGFDLPTGAVLLARGAVFENQFFRFGPSAFGVQFHPEVTPEIMRRWLAESRGDFGGPGTQGSLEQHLRRLVHGPRFERWIDGFLDHWLRRGDAPVLA